MSLGSGGALLIQLARQEKQDNAPKKIPYGGTVNYGCTKSIPGWSSGVGSTPNSLTNALRKKNWKHKPLPMLFIDAEPEEEVFNVIVSDVEFFIFRNSQGCKA